MDAPEAGRASSVKISQIGKPFDAQVILQHLGKCGPYQLMYFVCTAYAMLFPTAVILSVIFTAAVPAHRCFVSGCDSETDPSYVASWMSNLTVENLTQGTSKEAEDWSCQFQNISSSPECQPNNYEQQEKCNRWVYDQSMVLSSIVTQVSRHLGFVETLAITYLFIHYQNNLSITVRFGLPRFVEIGSSLDCYHDWLLYGIYISELDTELDWTSQSLLIFQCVAVQCVYRVIFRQRL